MGLLAWTAFKELFREIPKWVWLAGALLVGAYLWHLSSVSDAYRRGKADERAAIGAQTLERLDNALDAERRARDGLVPGGVPNAPYRRD